jgi:hypothetical protein
MEINDRTVFINHCVGKRDECFGFVVTNLDGAPYATLVASQSGTIYAGAATLEKALKIRGYVWAPGEDIKNEVHIVPALWLTNMLLGAFPDALR